MGNKFFLQHLNCSVQAEYAFILDSTPYILEIEFTYFQLSVAKTKVNSYKNIRSARLEAEQREKADLLNQDKCRERKTQCTCVYNSVFNEQPLLLFVNILLNCSKFKRHLAALFSQFTVKIFE